MHCQPRSAFTLIELSIVLVIIGLILGGVLVGKDLIRVAQVNGAMSQVEKYKIAINMFKDKYNGVPGDNTKASQIWGNYSYNSGTDVATGARTGTGEGFVGDPTMGWEHLERLEFWRHLSLSGLVQGDFRGYTGTLALDKYFPGRTFPSPMNDFSFVLWPETIPYGNPAMKKNFFQIGGFPASAVTTGWETNYPLDAGFTNPEAKQIDAKFDDGKADSGSITAVNSWTSTHNNACAGTPRGSGTPDYDSTDANLVNNKTKKECILLVGF